MQPILLDKQVSDDCVIVIEPVPMLAACAAKDSQGGRLNYVPQLTPSVLHGSVLASGGGGGDGGGGSDDDDDDDDDSDWKAD
ncbi:hypothetical protein SprV_0200709500 [Sparganum proliferum]